MEIHANAMENHAKCIGNPSKMHWKSMQMHWISMQTALDIHQRCMGNPNEMHITLGPQDGLRGPCRSHVEIAGPTLPRHRGSETWAPNALPPGKVIDTQSPGL